ncbi:MAG TPA: SigE family RNA polymerase sigma factor [Frankiaceae bacterium]|nr:SigE family RNA polymerase sigma factor [Frankiaceae bacterium]
MDRQQVKAFEAFVGVAGDALFRIATLLTNNRAAAEDLYQDTLQRIASRWSRVDNPMAFSRKVMHNLAIDEHRRTARRPRQEHLHDGHDRGDVKAGDSQEAVELRAPLLRALDTLSAQQRTVVVLRYFEDRSEADVAALLDISPGTVKTTASRAMARLRSHPELVQLFCHHTPTI